MVGEIIVHPNGLASNVPKGQTEREKENQQSITLLLLLCVEFIFIEMFRGSKRPTQAAV